MDFRDIDWHSVRPDDVAVASDWNRTIIAPLAHTDARLSAVVEALVATHVNGGAQLAQFEISAAPAVRWALCRNRWNEFDLFGRFFRHPSVVAMLPVVAGVNQEVRAFQMEGSFTVLGRLADTIFGGGAYKSFPGSDEQALEIAINFMRSACDMRLSETSTWVNWKPWTSWFLDVAWDGTFLWFDTRRGIATVLMVTDTD